MQVSVHDLRSIIREAMGPGIRLVRAGGLSPIKQAKGTAPEKYGVWAFIWPHAEMFLLGSTSPEGITHKSGQTRYDQLKREGWRKFIHKGVLYTRIPLAGVPEINGWYRTDGSTLANYLSKYHANLHKQLRQMGHDTYQNPGAVFSKDEFEVFVPEPDEGGF